jgi:hypothetical protein
LPRSIVCLTPHYAPVARHRWPTTADYRVTARLSFAPLTFEQRRDRSHHHLLLFDTFTKSTLVSLFDNRSCHTSATERSKHESKKETDCRETHTSSDQAAEIEKERKMAGQDIPADPAKALEYKEKGNKCFQAGDYAGAEELYSQAYVPPPSTPHHCSLSSSLSSYNRNKHSLILSPAYPTTQKTPSSTPTALSPSSNSTASP